MIKIALPKTQSDEIERTENIVFFLLLLMQFIVSLHIMTTLIH